MAAGPVALALGCAYLLGALPFSLWIGLAVHGVDIRQRGSGNVGATNLGRSCGWRSGAAGLVLDAAKGWAAVVAGGALAGTQGELGRVVLLLCGAAAVAGHMWPVFLLGHGGGKGVATSAGVFLALDPVAVAVCAALFAATVAWSRFVSLGSVLASAALPVALFARASGARDPVFLLSIPIALGVIWKHRTNLARIREGTESRLGRQPEASGEGPA